MCDCGGQGCTECIEYEYDDDGDTWCFWCGGDGTTECDVPLECTKAHDRFGYCKCDSCGGSGLAKDMTIW